MQVLRCLPKQETLNLTVSLGRGGEACVYAVPSDENLVAKIYHKPIDTYAHKLQAMIANPPENPTANLGHISIAWPQELLQAADGSGSIIGFLMPRIQGMRPIMDFYNPGTRRQNCPLFSYQYLLRTARNLATAFAALHASQYCIGDVNESNILVSNTALVTLVDTDSFQVRDPEQNIIYRCSVGKPEYTPPELQNKTFADYDRESYHDLFGLAVLIFQLLMEGTHPFSGIFQGLFDPPAYEARIVAGHFTYSQKQKVPYLPTPIAPPWEMLHPRLQELFVRCFEDGNSNPELRPTAQAWLSAIAEAEESLVTCAVNPQHFYHHHLDKCPWCERALQLGGRDPFPSLEGIASGEHLKPRRKSRKRHIQTPRLRKPGIPTSPLHHWQPVFNQNVYAYQPAKKPNKLKFYTIIFCLLGVGLLGYLDVMIKFTRPFVSQNPYTQQSLISSTENNILQTDKRTFEDYYNQGNDAYQKRSYEQAIENFTQGIKRNPNFSKLYINRGNARYNLSDYEGALADYNQALKINPHEVKALVNRGNVYYMLADYSSDPDKEYKKAINNFNTAIDINYRETEAYIRRGIVRSQIAKYSSNFQQEYQNSIADFSEAIKLNAHKAEAYFQRGLARYQFAQYSSNYAQEYKQAIADFNQALNINPRMAKVYLKRGMVHYELAQYGESKEQENHARAIEDLEKSAQIYLEDEDMDNYQQALSNICVIVSKKCDSLFQNSTILNQVKPQNP
ncbi:tetratricopeptide repeat protein [Sphaerospermopsis aphanizomenoides BCCUSP55]|uniref:tetratricopeptide repeat protein n=1 Tax=Sphaerospermopsis aphanizomenoides TaxID=459663 RepID=UPI000B1D6269|nr:tetratricopeptide repeat protein [Sphaerospermopsis aphanizomenoides]MBK1986690.1 tetratricopeptide repeat protein [Sphaerospermopsis aphanizomenoides BCCUSP55]